MRSPLNVLLEVKIFDRKNSPAVHDKILITRQRRHSVLFIGPFTFTYSRGNGDCKNPVSNIESCTEDSRMLLSFQACPDVVGTESTGEPLNEQLTSQTKKSITCTPLYFTCFTSRGIDVLGDMERR